MRFEQDSSGLDRTVAAFVLAFAIWTAYVHLITASHASLITMLHWLPLVVLIAAAATIAWFRMP
ncbi:MAG TPA: hypothetical protein VFY94_06740, partial [Rhodanobacteraceae bacterium]|nr:hypothetical protein [Rhodanobacteraceae bacterium]